MELLNCLCCYAIGSILLRFVLSIFFDTSKERTKRMYPPLSVLHCTFLRNEISDQQTTWTTPILEGGNGKALPRQDRSSSASEGVWLVVRGFLRTERERGWESADNNKMLPDCTTDNRDQMGWVGWDKLKENGILYDDGKEEKKKGNIVQ